METNIIIEPYKFEIIHNEAVFLGNNLKASAIQRQQQMVIIFLIPTMQTNIPQHFCAWEFPFDRRIE